MKITMRDLGPSLISADSLYSEKPKILHPYRLIKLVYLYYNMGNDRVRLKGGHHE
jgi:hypothetical protein